MTRDRDATEHVPEGPVPSSEQGRRLLDLVKVMARLRAPGGCPWDREQTHATLARHLLEETHELLDAIDRDDREAIRDELGDLLLQVVFHAQIASDDGGWDVDDVARALVEKLIHRHPHVFGDVAVSGADEVLVNWERLKAEEAGARPAVEDDIPATLPALARAAKVQRRAAGWGVAWSRPEEAVEALRSAVADVPGRRDDAEARIGALLFAAVAAARALGVDAESALRRSTHGFADRFERSMAAHGDVGAVPEDEARALLRDP
ncbi:MAG TPA: nucleoside triphosphate pyrophosphohydrolase [Actinomycetota bacterium]|nr:nucleoside triphosphate pyrophosphohydrolase [Actinomycetota bacterium]